MLVDQIAEALSDVDRARAELACVTTGGAPLRDRRQAYARVRHSIDAADALLRQALAIAKKRSYRDWSLWRHRLSCLDTARQLHLFAERDDSGVLPTRTVRTIDNGMSGPAIGDLQHGESLAPGTPATYGLDLEALLTATPVAGPGPLGPREEPAAEALEPQVGVGVPARTGLPRAA